MNSCLTAHNQYSASVTVVCELGPVVDTTVEEVECYHSNKQNTIVLKGTHAGAKQARQWYDDVKDDEITFRDVCHPVGDPFLHCVGMDHSHVAQVSAVGMTQSPRLQESTLILNSKWDIVGKSHPWIFCGLSMSLSTLQGASLILLLISTISPFLLLKMCRNGSGDSVAPYRQQLKTEQEISLS